MTAKKLTIEEAAKLVERSPRQIQRYIRDGLKAEVGRDRKKRVTLPDLQAWILRITPTARIEARLTDRHAHAATRSCARVTHLRIR